MLEQRQRLHGDGAVFLAFHPGDLAALDLGRRGLFGFHPLHRGQRAQLHVAGLAVLGDHVGPGVVVGGDLHVIAGGEPLPGLDGIVGVHVEPGVLRDQAVQALRRGDGIAALRAVGRLQGQRVPGDEALDAGLGGDQGPGVGIGVQQHQAARLQALQHRGGGDRQLQHVHRAGVDPGQRLVLHLGDGNAVQLERGERLRVGEAAQRAAAHGGPFALHGVDLHGRAGGQRGHGALGGVGLGVQPGFLAQPGRGDGLRRGLPARAVRVRPGGVRQLVPGQLDAGVVVVQYVLAGQALARHDLRAALAHAQAAAAAPEGDLKGALVLGQPYGLVVLVVDAQAVPLFQAAVGGHAHGDLEGLRVAQHALPGDGQAKCEHGVQAAGRFKAGRLQRRVLDGRDGDGVGVGADRAVLQRFDDAPDQRLVELRLQLLGVAAQRGRLPDAGALVVVGVVPHLAVGQRRAQRVLAGLDLPAVGIAEDGRGQLAFIGQHQAPGVLHGAQRVGVFPGVAEAAVAEAVAGVGQVVGRAAPVRLAPQGVGARRHGLGLQRLDAAGRGHFAAHHAAQIVFDVDVQHRGDHVAGGGQRQVAAEPVGQGGGAEREAAVVAGGAQQPGRGAQGHRRVAHVQRQRAVRGPHAHGRAGGHAHRGIRGQRVVAVRPHLDLIRRAQPGQPHPQHAVRLRPCRNAQKEQRKQRQRRDQCARAGVLRR